MNQKTKQNKLSLVFSISTLALLLGFIIYEYTQATERKELIRQQKETTFKHIHDDVRQTYEIFKSFAHRWNNSYAKLSRNHTRDTLTHPKYTVLEFGRKHQDIVSEIDNLKKQLNIWNPLPEGYVVKNFNLDYDIKHLVRTYRIRDDFFDLTQDLEQAFIEIINHHKPADTVLTTVYEREPNFTPYFRNLQRMDRMFIDLVLFRYPKDLAYTTNTSPEFVAQAQRLTFGTQLNELENSHNWEKYKDDYASHSYANICATATGELTTYLVKENRGKVLSLIKSEIDLAAKSPEELQQSLKALAQCTASFTSTLEVANYYYIVTQNAWYFSRNVVQGFRPVDERAREELMTFYEDENKEYYILGGYEAIDVFYPNQDKPDEKPVPEGNQTK